MLFSTVAEINVLEGSGRARAGVAIQLGSPGTRRCVVCVAFVLHPFLLLPLLLLRRYGNRVDGRCGGRGSAFFKVGPASGCCSISVMALFLLWMIAVILSSLALLLFQLGAVGCKSAAQFFRCCLKVCIPTIKERSVPDVVLIPTTHHTRTALSFVEQKCPVDRKRVGIGESLMNESPQLP